MHWQGQRHKISCLVTSCRQYTTNFPPTQLFTWLSIKGFTDRSLEEDLEVKLMLIFKTRDILVLNMPPEWNIILSQNIGHGCQTFPEFKEDGDQIIQWNWWECFCNVALFQTYALQTPEKACMQKAHNFCKIFYISIVLLRKFPIIPSARKLWIFRQSFRTGGNFNINILIIGIYWHANSLATALVKLLFMRC